MKRGSPGSLLCVWLIVAFAVPSHCQCNSGLHAAILAQFVPLKNGYTEEAHIHLSFVLLNDADQPIDVDVASWKIILDGRESQLRVSSTVMPSGGYGVLKPDEHYEWAGELPISRYFSNGGKYRIAFKGSRFESSTITVDIPPAIPNSE